MNVHIIKQVPPESVGGKTLFAGADGKFYSAQGRELKPSLVRRQTSPSSHGGDYPMMRNFQHRLCHHLIWETFVGPCTPGMEIDHINGNRLDWSLRNLDEVTPAENRKRAKILRILRASGIDPFTVGNDNLKALFASFDLANPDDRMIRELTHHCEI